MNYGAFKLQGVVIQFDEDHDERVIPVVAALNAALEHRGFPNVLSTVQEHEGTLLVVLKPFCRDWFELQRLIEGLVTKLSYLIVLDSWTTEFVEGLSDSYV